MFPDPDSHPDLPKLEIFNPSGATLPFKRSIIPKLLFQIEKHEHVRFTNLEIVFTDEDGIVEINSKYLEKTYITDTISFRYDEDESNQTIEGTIYCCAPRIEEQARELHIKPREEYLRIIAHAMLHLAGYSDKTEEEKKRMTGLENVYLSKFLSRS